MSLQLILFSRGNQQALHSGLPAAQTRPRDLVDAWTPLRYRVMSTLLTLYETGDEALLEKLEATIAGLGLADLIRVRGRPSGPRTIGRARGRAEELIFDNLEPAR